MREQYRVFVCACACGVVGLPHMHGGDGTLPLSAVYTCYYAPMVG